MSAALTTSTALALHHSALQLGLDLSAPAIDTLESHLDLVVKWNAVHNLTAIRDKAKMLTHHVLDSLAVARYLPPNARVLDVGSGAGFPGIPLAIARPDLAVTVLDSNQKKGAFLQQVITTLQLRNVTAVARRVEQLPASEGFDVVIARAFSELVEFVALTHHQLAPDGRLFAMKGILPDDELKQLPANVHVERTIELAVPGLDAKRHLLILRPS